MAYASWSVVFGEQPSAAKWNILGTNDASFNDGTGIAGLYKNLLAVDSNPYKFSAYRNAAWTTANGSLGKVTCDVESFDTNGNFASGTYTAPVSGFYLFCSVVQASVASGYYLSAFYVNGAEVKRGNQSNTGASTLTVSTSNTALIQLTATNTVDLYYQGTGGAGATGANLTNFEGFLVCRT